MAKWKKFVEATGKGALITAIIISRWMVIAAFLLWTIFRGAIYILTLMRPVYGLFIIVGSIVVSGIFYLLTNKLIGAVADWQLKRKEDAQKLNSTYASKKKRVLVKCRCGHQFEVETEVNGEWFGVCAQCGERLRIKSQE